MFKLFARPKKPEASSGSLDALGDEAPPNVIDSKPSFEVNADFSGLNGWPGDVAIVRYLSVQGLLCAGTENGAILVYGKGFQYFRHCPIEEPVPVQNILSVGSNLCLIVYNDNSLAVLRLPSLELCDTLKGNWTTNSDEFPDAEISSTHVDEFAEGNQKTFVYVGTSLGDVHVLEVASSGSVRICEYTLTFRDVELPSPMRVSAILSDEKCLMIGYERINVFEDSNNSVYDSPSPGSSPRNEPMQRYSSFISEPQPHASLSPMKAQGAVVVFNITKRRVRHSYPTGSGINFLLWDSAGDSLYAVLRGGEILSLTACSGKSSSTMIWNYRPLSLRDRDGASKLEGSDEGSDDQVVRQIRYIPPQTENNTNNSAGCYLVLVNANIIVGLSPSGPHGEMTEIMKFPCPPGDEITDFLVVPLFPVKSSGTEKEVPSSKPLPSLPVPAVPALLIVTRNSIQKCDEGMKSKYSETIAVPHQKSKSNIQQSLNVNCSKDSSRDPRPPSGTKLKVIPCPPGITTIPTVSAGATAIDVAVAIAVTITDTSTTLNDGNGFSDSTGISLPFRSGKLSTCMSALPPCPSDSSLNAVLLGGVKSAGAPCDIPLKNDQKEEIEENNSFEIVLAAREGREDSVSSSLFYDVVLLGQTDGSVSAWACSPCSQHSLDKTQPSDENENEKDEQDRSFHCVWHHLRTFSAYLQPNPADSTGSRTSSGITEGSSSSSSSSVGVTVVGTEEGSGLVSAGTADGDVVVWEVFQRGTEGTPGAGLGYVEHCARERCRVMRSEDSFDNRTIKRERDDSKSSSEDPSSSPDTGKGSGFVFSWDDEEEEDDQDDEEEEEDEDTAVVYDINKPSGMSDSLFKLTNKINADKLLKKQHPDRNCDDIKLSGKSKSFKTPQKSPQKSPQQSPEKSPERSPKQIPNLKLDSLKDMKINDEGNVDGVREGNTEESSLSNVPFRPDGLREAFRAKVPGSVTCQLLISDALMLVVGTSLGGVYISRGFDEKSFAPVDLSGLWKATSKALPIGCVPGPYENAVTGIVHSIYSSDGDSGSNRDYSAPLPVIYVSFSCGNLAVVCLQTGALIAFGLSDEVGERSGLQSILKKRAMTLNKKNSNSQMDKDYRERNDWDGSDNDCDDPGAGWGAGPGSVKYVAASAITDHSYEEIKTPKYTAHYSEKRAMKDEREVSIFTFVSLTYHDPSLKDKEKKLENKGGGGGSNTARGDKPTQEPINVRTRSRSNSDVFSSFRSCSKGSEDKDSPSQSSYDGPVPKYILLVVGSSLVTYDINKFCKLSSSVCRLKRSYSITAYSPAEGAEAACEVSFTAGKSGVQTSQIISNSPFITGRQVQYKEKLISDPDPPCSPTSTSCFTAVNSRGIMITLSVKTKNIMCDTNLLSRFRSKISSYQEKGNIYGENNNHSEKNQKNIFNCGLKSGILLPNGSCYILQKNGLILNYIFSSKNSQLLTNQLSPRTIPTNSSNYFITPSHFLFGSQEHELKVSNCQSSLRNKQSSLFGGIKTVHSGPADLMKLFAKTRDKKYRKEKDKYEKLNATANHSVMGSREDHEKDRNERERDYDGSSDRSPKANKLNLFSNKDKDKDKDKNCTNRTDSVSNLMSENMKNLEERGDKLKNLNNQADDLNSAAQTFRELAKQQKDDLKKRASRWGGIL